MGYDFSLGNCRNTNVQKFPCDWKTKLEKGDEIPKCVFEEFMLKLGGRQNGESGWMMEFPDRSMLCLDYAAGGVYIDVHCQWKYVLRLYRWILTKYPEAIIFDPQSGINHNLDSFIAFIKENGMPVE